MISSAKEMVKKKMLEERIFSPLVDKTFDEFDLNHSGFIELEEFAPLINDIHRTLNLPPPSTNEVKKELKRLDNDKDGKLSKDEYRELVHDLILYTIELL